MKYVILIFYLSFTYSYFSQTIIDKFVDAPIIYVNSIFDLQSIKSVIENSPENLICLVDSLNNQKRYYDTNIQSYIDLNTCETECDDSKFCGCLSFKFYDKNGIAIANWIPWINNSFFHSINYFYTIKGEKYEKKITIGCLKGQTCKWNSFSEVYFSGNIIDKNYYQFSIMYAEIKKYRPKYCSNKNIKKSNFRNFEETFSGSNIGRVPD